MNFFSQNFSAPFRGQFHEEYDAFQRLYAHQLIECRTGGHVLDQMRRLVEDHVTEPLSSVADAVHRWLSDRYDTKLWHVVVWNGARRRFSFDSQFYVTSSASQVNAAALSVDAEHLAAVDLKLSRTAQHAAVVFNLMLRLHADKPRDAGVHQSSARVPLLPTCCHLRRFRQPTREKRLPSIPQRFNRQNEFDHFTIRRLRQRTT